jgi:membrane fusion protein (multidrug efflux system)
MSEDKKTKHAMKILIATIVGAAIVGLCFTGIWIKQSNKKRPKPATPYVSVTKIKTDTWQPFIKATGNLQSYQGTTIKSETNGRITKINFHSGDHVKSGQILVELDNVTQKGKLDYAKAQLKLSELTYQRNQKLVNTQAISKSDFDTARYTYQSNKAEVEQSQSEFDKTIIKAPFDGILGLSDIAVGDYISQSDTIVNIQQLDPMYVDFTIPEKFIRTIKHGLKVTIVPNSYPNKKFDGEVYAYDSNINTDTGTLEVRATVPNHEYLLLPGNFVEVTLYTKDSKQVLTIPQTAVNYSATGDYVYRVINNKAVKSVITLGPQIGQSLIVKTGLSANDTVISAGTNKVHNGSDVHPVTEK